MKYAYIDKYESEEELLPYFNNVLKNNNISIENRMAYEYAVFSKTEDCFIGFADIDIHKKNSSGGYGEIGYFLLPEFWGRGYATEIATMLIEVGFKHINLHKIEASCNYNNLESENIMQKIGMVKEGELRKIRCKDNRWDNEKRYSILIEEWPNNKETETSVLD